MPLTPTPLYCSKCNCQQIKTRKSYRTMARIRKINTLICTLMPRLLISSLVNACKQEVEVCCFNRL